MVDHPQLSPTLLLDIMTLTEPHPLSHIQVTTTPGPQQKEPSHSLQPSVNKSLRRYFKGIRLCPAVPFLELFKMLVQVNLRVQLRLW